MENISIEKIDQAIAKALLEIKDLPLNAVEVAAELHGRIQVLEEIKKGEFQLTKKYCFVVNGMSGVFDGGVYDFNSMFDIVKYIIDNNHFILLIVFLTDNPDNTYIQFEEYIKDASTPSKILFTIPNFKYTHATCPDTVRPVWRECKNLQMIKQMILFIWFKITDIQYDFELPDIQYNFELPDMDFDNPQHYTEIPMEYVEKISRSTMIKLINSLKK